MYDRDRESQMRTLIIHYQKDPETQIYHVLISKEAWPEFNRICMKGAPADCNVELKETNAYHKNNDGADPSDDAIPSGDRGGSRGYGGEEERNPFARERNIR